VGETIPNPVNVFFWFAKTIPSNCSIALPAITIPITKKFQQNVAVKFLDGPARDCVSFCAGKCGDFYLSLTLLNKSSHICCAEMKSAVRK
jgi:hypothetical protein